MRDIKMNKLLALLLLSPLAFAEDVFLECNAPPETDPLDIRTVNFHIKLDTQLVKSTGKYVKYNQGTKGMISWKEYTNYDDGTFITNAYLLDRTDLSLLIITGHSHKGSSSLRYTCNKKEIKF